MLHTSALIYLPVLVDERGGSQDECYKDCSRRTLTGKKHRTTTVLNTKCAQYIIYTLLSGKCDDTYVLQTIGHDLVQDFVATTVETFFVAIYTVLAFTAGRLLLRTHRTNISLCTSFAMASLYILAVSLWIIDVRNVITEVRLTLLSNFDDSLEDLYGVALTSVLRLVSVQDVLYAFMTNIGDCVIIWRVYAFWSSPKERFVLLIPLAFLLGSLSTSAALSFCAARLGADITLGTYQHPAFCRNIQTASYSTTLATTAVATILISYKTWQYRKTHLAAFGSASPRTRTLRVMIGLIETGVIYMLFFVVQIVMSDARVNALVEAKPRLAFGLTIYEYITSLIVGIYPTIVVILVHSNYSVVDSRVGTSSRVLMSTGVKTMSTRGGSEGGLTHSNTSTAVLADTARRQKTEINLYEMTQLSNSGEEIESKAAPSVVRDP